jgi:hypothetical protein
MLSQPPIALADAVNRLADESRTCRNIAANAGTAWRRQITWDHVVDRLTDPQGPRRTRLRMTPPA